MKMNDSPYKPSIIQKPKTVGPENAEKLFQEIDKRVSKLYAECHDMQCMALSFLVNYYSKNTSALKGTNLEKQLDAAIKAPAEDKVRLFSQLKTELKRYVRSVFVKQKVPLLRGVYDN